MAPLPTENTQRLYLDYVSNSSAFAQEHTMLIRLGDSVNPFDAQDEVFLFLNAIGEGNFLLGWRVLQVRHGAKNDPNTFPIAMAGDLAEFEGSGSLTGHNNRQETVEHRFVGRGAPSGRRTGISIYGLGVALPDTFRTDAIIEPANWVRNATVVLNTAGNTGNVFTNIGLGPTFWAGYANWQQNSYWESETRS